jgi:predicted metal-binding membrane protein
MHAVITTVAAERRAFLWLMASLIGVSWLTLWLWEQSPYGRYLHHGQIGALTGGTVSALMGAALYITGWVLMTAAMMLPTTLPLLEIFRRLVARKPDSWQLVSAVIAGYLGVWLLFGIAAHAGDWVLHEVAERSRWLESDGWIIGAATLLVAGGFQFSSLKYRCLDKCRAPLSFVMEHWRGRHERRNAFRLGVYHGIFCVGCCWALMLLMFGVGVGNVGWMLALGAVMAMEKNLPWGRKVSAPVGVVLLVCGTGIFLNHTVFTGF